MRVSLTKPMRFGYRFITLVLSVLMVAGSVVWYTPAVNAAANYELVSHDASGATVSADGRYVSFTSSVDNLVPGDTNNTWDMFVYDRTNQTYHLVSVDSSEQSADGPSYAGVISSDGTHVAFTTLATNLGGSTVNGVYSVYVRDLTTGTTVQVTDQGDNPTISGDGQKVVYSDPTYKLWVYDGAASTTSHVADLGPFGANRGQISVNGQHVLYERVVVGSTDIYMKDLASGIESSVTGAPQGSHHNLFSDLSADGRYVSYVQVITTGHGDLTSIYRKDMVTGQLDTIGVPNVPTVSTSITDDGRYVFYTTEPGGQILIKAWDSTTDVAVTICGPDTSLGANCGINANKSVAADGQVAVFYAFGGAIPSQDIYVYHNEFVPPDTTAPELATPSWTYNPKASDQATTLTIPASDDASGIDGAEYFLGDNDPGQGNGATMTLSNVSGNAADLTTTFGTNFATGVYKVGVRAKDSAGNWSSVTTDYLVVYNPSGPKMTGKKTIVPSLSNGDVLPGLTANNQTDKAKFGFSVKYNSQGQINQNSDLQFSYSTGTGCNNPNRAQNCHDLALNATNIAWLATTGSNLSTGIFQGTGALTVDGQISTVLFRVTGVDGERLGQTDSDQFQIHIYPQTANPNTDPTLYRVNLSSITRGSIKIGDSAPPPAD